MPRVRREHPAPLPGIVRLRIVGDDQATARVLAILREEFTCTDPAAYDGGRVYLDLDTRPVPPDGAGER